MWREEVGVAHVTTRSFDLTRVLPGPRYCPGCGERVCDRLSREPGVLEARCDPEEGVLTLTYDQKRLASGSPEEMVRRLALDEAGAVGHAVYRLRGLD